MVCRKCGRVAKEGALYCEVCGKALTRHSRRARARMRTRMRHRKLPGVLAAAGVVLAASVLVWYAFPDLGRACEEQLQAGIQFCENVMRGAGGSTAESKTQASPAVQTDGEVNSDTQGGQRESVSSAQPIQSEPYYYALKDMRISINSDNTVEASGIVDTALVYNTIFNTCSDQELKSLIPSLSVLPETVSFYLKATGSIENNKLVFVELQKVSIMGIPLPTDFINNPTADAAIAGGVNNWLEQLNKESGFRFVSVSVNNGALQINGQIAGQEPEKR